MTFLWEKKIWFPILLTTLKLIVNGEPSCFLLVLSLPFFSFGSVLLSVTSKICQLANGPAELEIFPESVSKCKVQMLLQILILLLRANFHSTAGLNCCQKEIKYDTVSIYIVCVCVCMCMHLCRWVHVFKKINPKLSDILMEIKNKILVL